VLPCEVATGPVPDGFSPGQISFPQLLQAWYSLSQTKTSPDSLDRLSADGSFTNTGPRQGAVAPRGTVRAFRDIRSTRTGICRRGIWKFIRTSKCALDQSTLWACSPGNTPIKPSGLNTILRIKAWSPGSRPSIPLQGVSQLTERVRWERSQISGFPEQERCLCQPHGQRRHYAVLHSHTDARERMWRKARPQKYTTC
jgi:hypothetical protein